MKFLKGLFFLPIILGFFACDFEGDKGKGGVNVTDGADGVSCSVLKLENGDDAIQCGENIVTIPKGKDGQDGEDGASCTIAVEENHQYLICGDNRIPLDGNETRVIELINLALTHVEVEDAIVEVAGSELLVTIDFNVPVSINEDLASKLSGYSFSRYSEKVIVLRSVKAFEDFPFSPLLNTWQLDLPLGLFENAYNPNSVTPDLLGLQVTIYSYVMNFETLIYDHDDSNVCESDFQPLTYDSIQSLASAYAPVLLSIAEQKAFNVGQSKVIQLNSNDDVQVTCTRS